MAEWIPSAEFRRMFQPPAWVTGGISTGDAAYLCALVARLEAQHVLEIGVAAGTSSAALLYALDQQPGAGRLYSVDIRASCYFDPHYRTGAATLEMYPAPRSRWILHVNADARRFRRMCRTQFDLIFIDGNHAHPWPLLDVLHVATLARPGAWIALHDLELPRLYPQFQLYGPAWLFEAWPGVKEAGTGEAENIGAVQVPADLWDLVPMACALLARHPWEAPVARAEVDLPEVFAGVTLALQARLQPRLR